MVLKSRISRTSLNNCRHAGLNLQAKASIHIIKSVRRHQIFNIITAWLKSGGSQESRDTSMRSLGSLRSCHLTGFSLRVAENLTGVFILSAMELSVSIDLSKIIASKIPTTGLRGGLEFTCLMGNSGLNIIWTWASSMIISVGKWRSNRSQGKQAYFSLSQSVTSNCLSSY